MQFTKNVLGIRTYMHTLSCTEVHCSNRACYQAATHQMLTYLDLLAKPAWAPTLALINPYSPRILFSVLRITSSPCMMTCQCGVRDAGLASYIVHKKPGVD